MFKSTNSKYALKTALLITLVPFVMLMIISYSLWILMLINYSYFVSNGFPVDQQYRETFFSYVFQFQIENLPYLALFFILVFFLGIFVAHLILREFNQIAKLCENLLSDKTKQMHISGLRHKKLLVKLGFFIKDYFIALKQGQTIKIPDDIMKVKTPTQDWVFYFQFFCLMGILMGVTLTAIHLFTIQLHESIVQSAFLLLKNNKTIPIFLNSQQEIMNLIIKVTSVVAFIFYFIIAGLIISRIEKVTYAFVRDIRMVAKGMNSKRIKLRANDPGQEAATSINKLLDELHPQ